ncbi:MAG: hypothetical protein ACJ74Z_02955 [Bryobacteraceae bacterium]
MRISRGQAALLIRFFRKNAYVCRKPLPVFLAARLLRVGTDTPQKRNTHGSDEAALQAKALADLRRTFLVADEVYRRFRAGLVTGKAQPYKRVVEWIPISNN